MAKSIKGIKIIRFDFFSGLFLKSKAEIAINLTKGNKENENEKPPQKRISKFKKIIASQNQ